MLRGRRKKKPVNLGEEDKQDNVVIVSSYIANHFLPTPPNPMTWCWYLTPGVTQPAASRRQRGGPGLPDDRVECDAEREESFLQ